MLITAWREDGSLLARREFEIAPNGSLVFNLTEDLGVPAVAGAWVQVDTLAEIVLWAESVHPVSGIAKPLPATAAIRDRWLIPYLASGNGYRSQVKLLNPSARTVQSSLQIFASDGTPLARQNVELRPGVLVRVDLDGDLKLPELALAHAEVLGDAGLIVSYKVEFEGSEFDALAVWERIDKSGSVYTWTVMQLDPGQWNGLVLSNPTQIPLEVQLAWLAPDGTIASSHMLDLTARGQASVEFKPPDDWQSGGVFRITAEHQLALLHLMARGTEEGISLE